MRISYIKHNSFISHFEGWLQGFAELADGVVTILSLGFLVSDFELRISFWRSRRGIERMKVIRERARIKAFLEKTESWK
jgi:hypothetical protein